jgi:aminopeptidase N
MLYGLYHSAKGITDRTDDTKPIVNRQYDSPDEQFSYLAYPKGGWVLHMLRSQLGEDLYRRCIKTYLERHQFGTVVTEDLNAVIEELSGRSFDRFFDQWVYHAHHPELEISYSWDEASKLAKLTINQNQKLGDNVLLFQFPLPVRFKSPAGTIDRQITVKEKSEDFYFALPEAPKLVRIDPELTLLAKIKFNPPEAMLQEQLKDKQDIIGRVLAIEQLANKKDHGAVQTLKEVLKNDPFYVVRVEAARALKAIHNDEAFAALADSLEQSDARVRHETLSALIAFYRSETYDVVVKQLEQEKNPDILSRTIRSLGSYTRPEVHDTLIRFLNSDSYRNSLADAAIVAIQAQDDPNFLEPLIKALKEHQAAFTSYGFGRGLEAVAHLARNEEKKDAPREFLLSYVNHRKRTVQLAALRALGDLGDTKSIPVLETFAASSKDSPQHDAADHAISALRAARKPADEWRDLRNEVLELQKQNRDLKKEMDTLKKRMDASEPKPAEKKSKKAAAKGT